jgi:HlyD family secretion protein
MIGRWKYVVFGVALPAVLAVGAAVAMPDWFRAQQSGMVYDTSDVSRGAIRKIVSTSGPVRALVTVQVGSQLSGQIVELPVDFNSEVKPGDVMAVLDDKTFVARVAQAKADLASAEAQLLNQDATVTKAEAVLRQAERNIQRQRELASRGVTAQATLDTAVRDIDVAKADISVARAQVEAARATVAQRKAQLDQAQIDLDRTRIRSPIDGTVISRTVDVGQTVAASLQAPELFKIAQDLRRIRIEAQVNEADVGAVSEGNGVEFTVDAYPERKFEGKVTQVRLAATELQNIVTYTVIIEAANQDRRLFPGMTANVQIETAKRDGVLRVANEVLRFKPRDRQATSEAAAAPPTQGRNERTERMLSQLKEELQLDEKQVAVVSEQMKLFFERMRAERAAAQPAGGGGPFGPPGAGAGGGGGDVMQGFRAKMTAELERVLQPIIKDEQRPLFDRWKRGRENTRSGVVWVLANGNQLESRNVRLGIADDQFTEIIGGTLKEGERAVSRAREASRR